MYGLDSAGINVRWKVSILHRKKAVSGSHEYGSRIADKWLWVARICGRRYFRLLGYNHTAAMMLDNLLHKFDYVRIMHENMANFIDVQAIFFLRFCS